MAQWGSGEQDWSEPSVPRASTAKAPVPDSWDAEEEETEISRNVDPSDSSKKLWDEANSRAPPPQVVLGSNSGSLGQTQVSQLTSNTPRTILKRPAAPSSTSSSSSAAAQKSIQEREASYQAARERIFGSSSSDAPSAEGSDLPKSSTIIRKPRGPETAPNEPTPKAGFVGRVRKQGHGRTISDLEGIGEAIKANNAASS